MGIRSTTLNSEFDSYTIVYDEDHGIRKPITVLTSYDLVRLVKEAYPSLPIEVRQQLDNLN